MRVIGLVLFAVSLVQAALVPDVRAAANRAEFDRAERLLETAAKNQGKNPEWLEAYSWLGRGALNNKYYDQALAYAAQTRKMCLEEMKKRPLDQEPRLPIAFGAASEVHAQALAAQGARSEAVAFLEGELRDYKSTSIRTRLHKNLNLLTLVGKPAPEVRAKEWLNEKPQPLSAYKDKAVLLFFWAHWCGDCKAQASALEKLQSEFGPRGLVVIAPTRYYGYAARGEDATPEVERQYIVKVLADHYSSLGRMPVPLDNETFMSYGSSTTPTLVLVDRKGIVRLYHPGAMSFDELSAKVREALPSS